jgi:hypothetical protein
LLATAQFKRVNRPIREDAHETRAGLGHDEFHGARIGGFERGHASEFHVFD